jgi:hypothetical protein
MTRNSSSAGGAQDLPNPEAGSSPIAGAADATGTPGATGVEAAELPTGASPEVQASYMQSIQDNYSQYRAVTPLNVDGVRAFNPGDPVNADHPMLAEWVDGGGVEAVAKPASSRKGKG